MYRVVISLSESQERKLRRVAAARRVSMAATIRNAIDELPDAVDPEREELVRRALEVVGKYRSGHSDVSVNHDAHLAEIYMDWGDPEDSEA
jgi:ABC-type polar amino acid transport system ATPase subunit